MTNLRLKEALKENNVKQWELANALHTNEFSLSRRLRKELSEKELKEFLKLIKTINSEREAI